MAAVDIGATKAFDPSRFWADWSSAGSAGGTGSGSGGLPGGYDGLERPLLMQGTAPRRPLVTSCRAFGPRSWTRDACTTLLLQIDCGR